MGAGRCVRMRVLVCMCVGGQVSNVGTLVFVLT